MTKEFKFSNFQMTPILIDGIIWPSVEHYYQAMKSDDPKEQARIRKIDTPNKAKREGRKLKMRSDWEFIKEDIMLKALREKFKQPNHKQSLLATKDEEIVEWNTWHDNIWGDCTCQKCRYKMGQNRLGKLLMKLREEIQ